MHWSLGLDAALAALVCVVPPLNAQEWNDPATTELVARAIARRVGGGSDSGGGLARYQTTAHGFVFYLVQAGSGLSAPPHLARADELKVEVYWEAPGRSKQTIRGWRNGAFLPSEMYYHRDHLGIVTNNYGDLIRLGDGDEVRDIVHPLSVPGRAAYDFALTDSLRIRANALEVSVHVVQVRPRDSTQPRVVGSLYLDVRTGELIRFSFTFTPSAYLESSIEDITVVLEHALHGGHFWLPWRQEIEIRRRTAGLGFPLRGVIRTRWEIGEYTFNEQVVPRELSGDAIAGLQKPGGPDSLWTVPFEKALAGAAAPVTYQDLDAVRVAFGKVVAGRVLSGLPAAQVALESVSDLFRVNRVQGIRLGVGARWALRGPHFNLHPSIGYGTSDHRWNYTMEVQAPRGPTDFALTVSRQIRDFSDTPAISPLLNSFLAQEWGHDHGDYVLAQRIAGEITHRLSSRTRFRAEVAREQTTSVGTTASPARGTYEPNPDLGAGTYYVGRLLAERTEAGVLGQSEWSGRVMVEAGTGPAGYGRAAFRLGWVRPFGSHALAVEMEGGSGTAELPRYRGFVFGGRGTLPGEGYRAFGGRTIALARAEWRIEVPVPSLRLGTFATTGPTAMLAPFIGLGWAGRAQPGVPWVGSAGVRPVVGVAGEFFMHLIRLEAGWALRTRHFGVTLDLSRAWWSIL